MKIPIVIIINQLNKNRIRYLLEQYYTDSLSHNEQVELSQLIDTTDYEEVINILAETINSSQNDESVGIDEAQIKANVSQIFAIDSGFQNQIAKNISRIKLFKYSIAAAAAIIVLIGSYLVFQSDFKGIENNNIAKTRQIDIQPGNKGAVLVLSDGTEVLLDSVSNSKIIVSRDGSKIKVKDGQIVYLDKKNAHENNFNTIRTPKGRQYQCTLPDGTKVWLNAASSIKYPMVFTKNTRKVTITGEAYFEVAKNPKKPFIVNIENSKTNVEVLGTHFNVNTYAINGTYKTTLLEGSIKLNSGNQQYLLKPLQQAISQKNSNEVQVISNIDPEDILAWKNDLFYFNEASIDDVMADLSRWYNIDVAYEGSKPAGTFTGKIEKSLTLRQALKILGATRVKYELKENNKLIIQ